MSDDLRPLRQLLRQAIEASGLPVRAIETRLGIRHGSLDHLLDGRSELQVRHILAVAHMLKVPPQDFLALGCPAAQEEARHRLKDWIEPLPFGPRSGQQANGTGPRTAASPEDLVEVIRRVVREELDASPERPGGRSDR